MSSHLGGGIPGGHGLLWIREAEHDPGYGICIWINAQGRADALPKVFLAYRRAGACSRLNQYTQDFRWIFLLPYAIIPRQESYISEETS